MYCSKCGKEVKNVDGYCSSCGAKIGASSRGIPMDVQEFARGAVRRLQGAPKTYYGSILIQIISVFLLGNSMFEVSYQLFGTYTHEIGMFDNKESWETLFTLGYLIAVAAMLYPAVFNKKWENWNFIIGMIMPAAAVLWFIAILINAANEVDLGGYQGFTDAINLSVGLSSNAVMFLIASICGTVLTYMAKNAVIKNEYNLERIEPNRKAKAKVIGVTMLPQDKIKDGRDVRLTFELIDGQKLNLLEKSEYQANLGDEGLLTWNGGIVVFFEKNSDT